MKALFYLLGRTIVNRVKSIIRKPGASIAYIVLIALFAWMIFFGAEHSEIGEVRNLDVYRAFVLGYLGLIFVMSISRGLKSGTTMFNMADVNLLFTSPIKPPSALIYGIMRQAGILILASLVMLAQYSNLRLNFGLGADAIIGLMIGYILMGICAQLFSANLYALCARKPERRKTINIVIRAFLVLLAGGIVYFTMQNGDIIGALRSFFGNELWLYVPVLGWSMAIAFYAAISNWLMASLFIFLMLLSCGGLILWLFKSADDYYEDALTVAETTKAAKDAAASGSAVASSGKASKRAKRDGAPLKGNGASAFFYRAMREQSRTTLWLFSLSTIAAIASAVFGMFVLGEMDAGGGIWGILIFGAYMLVFLSMTASIGKELMRHYVYIAPASPFLKLIAISTPQLLRYVADTVVFFALSLILLKLPLHNALAASLCYFSICVVFVGGLLLVERLLKDMKNRTLIVLLYFIILIVLVVPGFVLGMLLGSALSLTLGLVIASVWNILMGMVLVASCQGLLKAQ